MAKDLRWKFKAHFRAKAYGWRGTALASKRLQEAVSEIKKVAKTDPIASADGAVSLMEKLWPSLAHVDGSSGALGNAVDRTLYALIPILIDAPADRKTREKWLNRLYRTVAEDGVGYLSPVEESWGYICVFPDLKNEWADLLLPGLAEHWKNKETGHFIGIDICLSCLLEAKRYDELDELLKLHSFKFWHYDYFGAEALRRQGRTSEAIEFAKARIKDDQEDSRILEYCESLLLEAGRKEEAYNKYALFQKAGYNYITQYKSIVKKYPEREPRQILLDLITVSGDKASWFASARQAGLLNIALECAYSGPVNPHTLIRAARDTIETEPEFAAKIALRALDLLLQGYGFEISARDIGDALNHLLTAAESCRSGIWALDEVNNLLSQERKGDNKIIRQILIGLVEHLRDKR